MIELAFGESAAGGLKQAKSLKNEQGATSGSRGWSGITISGSSSDVESLTLALDIGDISDMDTTLNTRKKLLDDLFADFSGVSDEIWKTNLHALARLQEAKATMEPVRMWICNSDPAEICGFYFICHLMKNTQTPLSVVRIPAQIETEDSIISYRSTGEINPEAFGAFIKYEEAVSVLLCRINANIWNGFVCENAPLRVVINGTMIGVPEDFYDFAIRANIPDGEVMVAKIIGKTLGQIPGVGDRWLFLRIQAMIQSGELLRVSAATRDHPYSEVVRLNK